MRRHARVLACSLAASAVAALPAPASASGASAAAAGHAAYAQHAAHELAAAATGNPARALAALRAAHRHAAASSRAAKSLRRRGASRRSQARAFRMAARAYDSTLETYIVLLERADPEVAVALARALGPTLNGREAALTALTDLVATLPAPARDAAAAAIAAIRGGLPAQAGALADVDGLPVDVQALVDQAFAAAAAAAAQAVGHLQELLPLLPEPARRPVQAALAHVSAQLAHVRQLVHAVLAGIPAVGDGSSPAAGVLDALGGLLGGVLGRP